MKNDPYQTTARFTSVCPKCHQRIKKGDTIYIYPLARRGEKAVCACGADDFRKDIAMCYEDSHGFPCA